ncbi:MAG: FGGY-family carbohydrate kinase [Bryobacteraceae bacterium]
MPDGRADPRARLSCGPHSNRSPTRRASWWKRWKPTRAPAARAHADGGATANDFLMQFQADILGKPIVRPADIETTALGAAYLAGLATGYWSSADEVESFWRVDRRFEPSITESRRDALYAGWKDSVARAVLR